jgi:hypothetical protein
MERDRGKIMKTAFCYSGQLNGFNKAFSTMEYHVLTPDMDMYALSSDLVSQRVNLNASLPQSGKVHQYCPAGVGWRKNQPEYGIIYPVPEKFVQSLINNILGKYNLTSKILHEDLKESLEDQNLTKWQWLRKRQLYKLYECNNLLPENTYDIVVRSRFELAPMINVDIEKIVEAHDNIDNKIFLFGGWDCVAPMIFMDKYMCDGFAFGSQNSMNIFTSLYLQEEAYPYDPKYEDCWLQYGDNVEYQFQEHLKAHNIEIVYINNKRTSYHNWR